MLGVGPRGKVIPHKASDSLLLFLHRRLSPGSPGDGNSGLEQQNEGSGARTEVSPLTSLSFHRDQGKKCFKGEM